MFINIQFIYLLSYFLRNSDYIILTLGKNVKLFSTNAILKCARIDKINFETSYEHIFRHNEN